MIVVDTNVICYRWIPSAYSVAVETVLAKDPEWAAPLLWRSEFRNALAGALRQRLITLELALYTIEKAERHMANREFAVSSRAVLNLVARSQCSAYDCEFVALAEERRVPLVTVDRQLLREFPRTAVSLETFTR